MKKSILIPVVFCSFAVFTSLNSQAGGVGSDNGNSTTNAISTNSEARNMSTKESINLTDRQDGEDNDYSWIGLLGLLGLAGFLKKDRHDINKTANR